MDHHSNNIRNAELIESAEKDSNGWSYLSLASNAIIKFNSHNIIYNYVTIRNNNIILVKLTNIYKLVNSEWKEYWMWLHNSGIKIIPINDVKKYDWGANVKKDFSKFIFRISLLKIYILRYIFYIKHKVWNPDSIYVKILKNNFDKMKYYISK